MNFFSVTLLSCVSSAVLFIVSLFLNLSLYPHLYIYPSPSLYELSYGGPASPFSITAGCKAGDLEGFMAGCAPLAEKWVDWFRLQLFPDAERESEEKEEEKGIVLTEE